MGNLCSLCLYLNGNKEERIPLKQNNNNDRRTIINEKLSYKKQTEDTSFLDDTIKEIYDGLSAESGDDFDPNEVEEFENILISIEGENSNKDD